MKYIIQLAKIIIKIEYIKYSIKGITTSFAILTLLLSIYSDIIVQYNTGLKNIVLLPLYSLLGWHNHKATIDDLIGRNKVKQKNNDNEPALTYMFVLDKSGSLINEIKTKPVWYNELIRDLNNLMDSNELKKEENPFNGLTLSIAKLSKILMDLMTIVTNDEQHTHKLPHFGIWTLGNEAIRIHPCKEEIRCSDNDIVASKESITRAIRAIQDDYFKTIENKKEQNSNFNMLFEKIIIRHGLKQNCGVSDFKPPKFILIVFGDLRHDMQNLLYDKANKDDNQFYKFFERDKTELIDRINTISRSDTLAKMIMLSDKQDNEIQKYEVDVWSLLKSRFDDWRLKKRTILKHDDKILYVSMRAKNDIYFYYTTASVEQSIFNIIVNKTGNYQLTLKTNNKLTLTPLRKIEYSIRKTDGSLKESKECSGILYPNTPTNKIEIQKNQIIQLSYSGKVPTGEAELLIDFPEEDSETYIFSIQFRKTLPWFSAFFICCFQIVFLLSIICFLLQFVTNRKNKRKKMINIRGDN